MSHISRISAVGALATTLACAFPPGLKDLNTITFSDPALQACFDEHNAVIQQVSITRGSGLPSILGYYPVSFMGDLNCPNRGIVDSAGLNQLVDLRNINLDSNFITDLDLGNLPFLHDLSVRDNDLQSLDVSGARSLQTLDVTANWALSSLSLTSNDQLRVLRLHQTSVTSLDLSGMSSLTDVEAIDAELEDITLPADSSLERMFLYENNFDQSALDSLAAFDVGLGNQLCLYLEFYGDPDCSGVTVPQP